MQALSEHNALAHSRVGRPRRGTEKARIDALIAVATQIFLHEGYGNSSIDKVASEAGVSTRTIYERYKNKAGLLCAVVTRLIDLDMSAVLAPAEIHRLEPRQALLTIGRSITERAINSEFVCLFRILATEAQRFPELASKMREATKARINNAIERYLAGQIERGTMQLSDPARAAALFMQMICGEIHERLLFGSPAELSSSDLTAHLRHAVEIFLCGALPRSTPQSIPGGV